jgi:hypothetical protein
MRTQTLRSSHSAQNPSSTTVLLYRARNSICWSATGVQPIGTFPDEFQWKWVVGGGAVKPVQTTGPTVLLLHVFHYLYCRLYKLTIPARDQVTAT